MNFLLGSKKDLFILQSQTFIQEHEMLSPREYNQPPSFPQHNSDSPQCAFITLFMFDFTEPRDPCKVKQTKWLAGQGRGNRELEVEELGLEGEGMSRKNPHELNTQINIGTWKFMHS